VTQASAHTLCFDEVQAGQLLPQLRIPITRTLVVATAIASRDYQDVHHDPGLATERGSPDIFMNILTTNGLVGRYVTDWAGPGAVLTDVSIRLGAPNYPGDEMVISGVVEKVLAPEDPEARGRVEVAVRGANRIGDHVTGTVGLTLPLRRSPSSSPSSAASLRAGRSR
jgi:3-oxo-4,17-pregnadiene-20-carboxyl-CoA hydratase beta subunit